MRNLLLILAVLLIPTSSFAASLIYVAPARAQLKDGTQIEGTLDYLCEQLAPDAMNNQTRRILDAKYDNLVYGLNGDASRKLACGVKSEKYTFENGVLGWYPENGGNYQGTQSFGPATCEIGGLYKNTQDNDYSLGCYIVK